MSFQTAGQTLQLNLEGGRNSSYYHREKQMLVSSPGQVDFPGNPTSGLDL